MTTVGIATPRSASAPGGPTPPPGAPESGDASLAARLAGPLLFLVVLLLPRPATLTPEAQAVAAVAVLMAVWWMTEAIPLAATSLLPIVLFPLLGVMSSAESTAPYGNHLIFLFMAGFFIALSMERWGLHRRIALAVVALIGTQPRRLVLGFMTATAFLSMWISNTATAVMMVPIGIAILVLFEDEPYAPALGTAMMLGIAYAATIGGMATLIGAPPNAVFAGAAEALVGRPIGFLQWMAVGFPTALVMLPITWFLLVRVLHPLPGAVGFGESAARAIQEQRRALGPMGAGERITATVFSLTVAGWLLRDPKEIGGLSIPGIASFYPAVSDTTIAMTGGLLLFVIPLSLRLGGALDWAWAKRIPWDVLLLFGGGLALAEGFESSGLAAWIGTQVSAFGDLPLLLLVALVAVLFMLLTEFTSNTATATMGMPVMAGVAVGVDANPLVLMGVAVLATQFSFMLPVATPPNAIVFGSGRVTIRQMMKAGLMLNLIGTVLIVVIAYSLMGYVFGE